MSKIVVAKLVRLGQDGGKFKKDIVAKVERTSVKIDEDYIKGFNENWNTSGRMYVINEKATKLRNESLEEKEIENEIKKEDSNKFTEEKKSEGFGSKIGNLIGGGKSEEKETK